MIFCSVLDECVLWPAASKMSGKEKGETNCDEWKWKTLSLLFVKQSLGHAVVCPFLSFFDVCPVFVSKLLRQNPAAPVHHTEGGGGCRSDSWLTSRHAVGETRWGWGWTDEGMEIEPREEEEAKERIRKGRAHDVEGKSVGDRKHVKVKRGWQERKKTWVSFLTECPLGVAVSSQSGG